MEVSKDSIDLGIVVSDEQAALKFYRDGLGLEEIGEIVLPGGKMYRLKCGTAIIKLVKLDVVPQSRPAGGGPMAALGLRYFTISVPDIHALMAQLDAKGLKPLMKVSEFRPGITIAMMADPDGNTVEFLQDLTAK